jgi:hypothetical protein
MSQSACEFAMEAQKPFILELNRRAIDVVSTYRHHTVSIFIA